MVRVGVRVLRGVVDVIVAIVVCAFGCVGEDLVGGGDGGEFHGGFWVGAVFVRVVAEGEGVELSREG
jgi:hypothetical protein